MKHSIRQRVINQYGLPVTKIETVNGELGSGIVDKNGKEIFEGDLVKFAGGNSFVVNFNRGCLCYGKHPLRGFDNGDLEIVDD